MSKKRIERYIPKAIEVLDREFYDGIIPSAYNGYISSFGASVMQSGLLPTLALFENTNASTKENKEYLSHLIVNILRDNRDDVSLLREVLDREGRGESRSHLKEQILDISIAIKLSIRTFKLNKGEKDE